MNASTAAIAGLMSAIIIAGCSPQISDTQTTGPLVALSNSLSPQKSTAAKEFELAELIGTSNARVDFSSGFSSAMRQAIDGDPEVLAVLKQAQAAEALLRTTKTGRDLKFDATVLGGVEDVTDEIAGVVGILSADRLLFDGGQLDAQIARDEYSSKAARATVDALRNERALKLAEAWIELEQYARLQEIINDRLMILEPLLVQLEQVAASGIGDVSQVAAAQRTVSLIRVTQTDVEEKYAQAKLAFKNSFGDLPWGVKYDAKRIENKIPKGDLKKNADKAPALLAAFYAYRAAEANAAMVRSSDTFNVSFQGKIQKPFGGSGYESDESIGLIATKNFFRGDQLKSRVDNAEASAASEAERVRSLYRTGDQSVLGAQQMIRSMDIAMALARENARITRDEIKYLKQQLVIGGSTLDSVLSAEARLYEAESKEIGFLAERRKAEAAIASAIGVLYKAVTQ